MLLIFCRSGPDVLSRDDLAIQRGLRMLYGRRSFSDREFQRIRRRYSPYGTVAVPVSLGRWRQERSPSCGTLLRPAGKLRQSSHCLKKIENKLWNF